MKRLLIFGLAFGPLLLMGQKKEDIVAIQRDLAKLVAPLATLGAKIDQMADDFRSASVNIADLVRKMDKLNARVDDISSAVRTLMSPPQAPPAANGGTSPQIPGA